MGQGDRVRCPYGAPGDLLYVREAWRTLAAYDALPPRDVPRGAMIWYEADGDAPPEFGRYRHARFMVRWMSRILCVVESIGMERLQDISSDDATAEGWPHVATVGVGAPLAEAYPISWFANLWGSINGSDSWDVNPWVWVVGFGLIEPGRERAARGA
jgi:hypothetical protein